MIMSLVKQMTIGLGVVVLWGQTTGSTGSKVLAAAAPPSTEASINQIFQSTAPLPGATAEQHQDLLGFKTSVVQWLGAYRAVQKQDNYYLLVLAKGTLPVTMEFQPNGAPKFLSIVGCPVTAVPVSKAPRQYQKAILAYCPQIKP
jgi:hypothetical protein